MLYKTDIHIACDAQRRPIQEVGANLGISPDDLLPFGHDITKVSAEFINDECQIDGLFYGKIRR